MRLFEFESKNKKELAFNTSIFNFGSMRDLDIFRIVLGRTVSKDNTKNAYIKGYRTVKVEGKPYPALVQDNVSITEGILVINLTPEDLDRIQHYEDGEYGTEILPINLKNGDKEIYAQVYSIHSSKLTPTDEDWNFDEFQKEFKPEYSKEVKKWMKEYKKDEE